MTAPDMSLNQPKANKTAGLDFFVEDAPENGTVTQITPDIYWLRMPLPMTGLDHINLWILRDGPGWAIIDTGIGSKASKEIWKTVFSGMMKNKPVTKVICTHLHPDHTGLAGWLCRRFDVPLLMTRGEYFLCRLMAADTGHAAPQAALDFYARAGFTDSQIELYKARFGGFGKAITPLPHGFIRMEDGGAIRIGDLDWTILVGSGHSPEHACLFNAKENICITGDQLLPNISSNVSVWPTEPEGNPLEDWIDSCKMLREELPEDVLVLPAHGVPFRGAHKRLERLIDHHEKALLRLWDFCVTPQLATQVYSCLFRREITDGNRIMAVGESLAHLNCLVARGLMYRRTNDAGQYIYRSKSAKRPIPAM
ncbi:MAG: MBL fold metallo-hydrolase [Robiginitomaculum sp.]